MDSRQKYIATRTGTPAGGPPPSRILRDPATAAPRDASPRHDIDLLRVRRDD
ncbi:MAG: hypothetical protein LBR22_00425 [Desulfovibrio sp.]|nr:hypothetical protein [Desulfovibrio sp.]